MNRPAPDTIEFLAGANVPELACAPETTSAPAHSSVLLYYVVEGVSTVGVALMLSGIYFYTTRQFK